jgi:hypothetical protein
MKRTDVVVERAHKRVRAHLDEHDLKAFPEHPHVARAAVHPFARGVVGRRS